MSVINLPTAKTPKARKGDAAKKRARQRYRDRIEQNVHVRVMRLFQAFLFTADNDNRSICGHCGNNTMTCSGTGLRGGYDRCAFCRKPKSPRRPR